MKYSLFLLVLLAGCHGIVPPPADVDSGDPLSHAIRVAVDAERIALADEADRIAAAEPSDAEQHEQWSKASAAARAARNAAIAKAVEADSRSGQPAMWRAVAAGYRPKGNTK